MNVIEIFDSAGGTWEQLIYTEGWYYVHRGRTGDGWAGEPIGPHNTQDGAKHCALMDWVESHARECPADDILSGVSFGTLTASAAEHKTACTAPHDAVPEFVVTRWQETMPPGLCGRHRCVQRGQ